MSLIAKTTCLLLSLYLIPMTVGVHVKTIHAQNTNHNTPTDIKQNKTYKKKQIDQHVAQHAPQKKDSNSKQISKSTTKHEAKQESSPTSKVSSNKKLQLSNKKTIDSVKDIVEKKATIEEDDSIEEEDAVQEEESIQGDASFAQDCSHNRECESDLCFVRNGLQSGVCTEECELTDHTCPQGWICQSQKKLGLVCTPIDVLCR